MITYTSEYEHLTILFLIVLLFILGLRKRTQKVPAIGFAIDKQFSGALKGFACVLILMAHYEQMMHLHQEDLPRGIAFIVGNTVSNIALVWFMFISGYGLTVSKSGIKHHAKGLYDRCSKVFYPMLFVFIVSLLIYIFLPGSLPESYQTVFVIPREFYMINGDVPFDVYTLLLSPIRTYWYVWCIMMFYTVFYFSDYLSQRFKLSSTWFLIILLTIYYIIAYNLLEPQYAHYYRLTWAFFFGHLFARWNNMPLGMKMTGGLLGVSTFYFESPIMILSFFTAIVVLLIVSKLQKWFSCESRALALLGTISYFFYLIHRRIGWVICCYTFKESVLFWTLIVLVISYILYKIYHMKETIFHNKKQ